MIGDLYYPPRSGSADGGSGVKLGGSVGSLAEPLMVDGLPLPDHVHTGYGGSGGGGNVDALATD